MSRPLRATFRNVTQWAVVAALISAGLAFHPHALRAEIFKSSEFLTWKRDSQDFYIRTSVGMASLIAAQSNKTQATCIDDWYFGDEHAANTFIRDVMDKNPSYHPRGIILGVIQKHCGSFKSARP